MDSICSSIVLSCNGILHVLRVLISIPCIIPVLLALHEHHTGVLLFCIIDRLDIFLHQNHRRVEVKGNQVDFINMVQELCTIGHPTLPHCAALLTLPLLPGSCHLTLLTLPRPACRARPHPPARVERLFTHR